MRFFSTAESADKGEISLLAIVETILASAIAIYLSVKFNSFKWIATSVCIAPFLLLRTEQSTRLAFQLFKENIRWFLAKSDELGNHPRVALSTGMAAALPWYFCIRIIVIRFRAILVTLYKDRFTSLFSIPANWVRATLVVDTCCPLELVPGAIPKGEGEHLFTVSWFLRRLWQDLRRNESDRWLNLLVHIIVHMPLVIVCYVLPFLYRWSMKATAIAYTPLLWITWATLRKLPDISARLTLICRSYLTRIRLYYSIVVITTLVAKSVVMKAVTDFANWLHLPQLTHFLAIYIAPSEIPLWQVGSFVNALLAVFLFGFTREALVHMETGQPWPTKVVESVLRASWFCTCALTLYTLPCKIYLTVQAASSWNLPPLGTKLFPWW